MNRWNTATKTLGDVLVLTLFVVVGAFFLHLTILVARLGALLAR